VDTLDFERVRQELIANHGIPARSRSSSPPAKERGLEQIDADYKLGIADPDCPVKFVITQKALAEGWDCPFAYILVSMASLSSATAVEQLLGRVLRQPNARHFDESAAEPAPTPSWCRATSPKRRARCATGWWPARASSGARWREFVTAARAEQEGDLEGHVPAAW
jgi:type III restriction enzyme